MIMRKGAASGRAGVLYRVSTLSELVTVPLLKKGSRDPPQFKRARAVSFGVYRSPRSGLDRKVAPAGSDPNHQAKPPAMAPYSPSLVNPSIVDRPSRYILFSSRKIAG
ncbi:hypothetical protein NE237_012014 [Protea cynaroides]|uniref:Uncharacterized protein n=1 Tax=Protea cynaroides TaxID=273540 RepID=A0A9Q0JX91_9MAGN|nr:hypothetical protein NE237_012014 [Protea cynaroides]